MLSTSINWEVSGWRAGLQKRIWECSLTAGKSHPAIHETQHPQPARRGDHPALFNVGAASP